MLQLLQDISGVIVGRNQLLHRHYQACRGARQGRKVRVAARHHVQQLSVEVPVFPQLSHPVLRLLRLVRPGIQLMHFLHRWRCSARLLPLQVCSLHAVYWLLRRGMHRQDIRQFEPRQKNCTHRQLQRAQPVRGQVQTGQEQNHRQI